MRFTVAALCLSGLVLAAASAHVDAQADVDPPRLLRRGGKSDEQDDAFAIDADQDTDEVVLFSNDPVEERRLMEGHPMYSPLQCNVDASIGGEECLLPSAITLSSLVDAALQASSNNVTSATPVIVPCGQCAVVDYTDGYTVTLPKGLDVVGRLYFPPTANVTLNTTAFIVQGQLDMMVPAEDNSVTVTLYGVDDQYFYPYDKCGDTYLDTCADRVNMGTKPIVVAGGKLNIQARSASCPSWTHLVSQISADQLKVDPAFANCVRKGEKLLVTSVSTQWDADEVVVVGAVDSENGIVTLETAIPQPLPALDGPGEPEFAVEVASLSRDVVFTAQADNPEEQIGGHLIIYHTPGVEQIITGAKFDSFGQGGILGRYPVHFHMSDESPSYVTKNVVTNSNQRCIVIHSTNQVTIDDNVAYDTRGHCYVTEVGDETNNVFKGNLGARTRLLQFSNGQSDSPGWEGKHITATFWVRNMQNEFYGNVAAGSRSAGWWLEMKDKSSSMLSTEPVSSFRDNVAHSNSLNGMTTYKPGWTPSEPGVFDNIRIYKNNGESGFKFHITGLLTVKNSLFADNKVSIRYGVWNKGVTVKDSKIIALSNDMKLREGKSCPITSYGVYASYNNYPSSSTPKAIDLDNVIMERFICSSKTITQYFDNRQNLKGMGNAIQASVILTEASVEKSKPYFGCGSNEKYTFLEDVSGGLGPSSMGSEPGFVLRNGAHMKAFLPPDACEPLPYGSTWSDGTRCNVFCKNVCLRYFTIQPTPSATMLTLSQGNVTYSYYLDSDSDSFRAVLPSGSYHGKFFDDYETEVVSDSVSISSYRTPNCADHADAASFSFTSHEPTSFPSSSPTISSAPTVTPDHVVRIRSDRGGKYLFVKSDGGKGLRLNPDPTSQIEVTLKKVSCPSSLDFYHSYSLTKDCYYLFWDKSSDRRLYARTGHSWTGGIGAYKGSSYYRDQHWFLEKKPCVVSAGDDCVLLRNAHNGRSLYESSGGSLGASPGGNYSSAFTNSGYRWKLIDILDDNAFCSSEGVACTTDADCCSHYCHGNGLCAR